MSTDRATVPLSVVTGLAPLSSTVTTGWVAKLVPSVTPPTGWVVTTSWLAAPTVMANGVLVPVIGPVMVALSV